MTQSVTPLALALWARRFSTLINCGVSLVRCLELLKHDSEEPLGSVSRQVQEQVMAGDTLSRAMAEHPDVFNRLSITLCRAGEVGGILDNTFAVWADWLERDMEFRARFETYLLLAGLSPHPRSRQEVEAELRTAMPDLEGRVREMTFCRIFGMMLGSGVPVLQALDVAANEVFPEDGAERCQVLKQAVLEPPYLLAPAFQKLGFSPFAVQLAATGEECGILDRLMEKAADLFQRELEVRMSAALAGLISAAARPEKGS